MKKRNNPASTESLLGLPNIKVLSPFKSDLCLLPTLCAVPFTVRKYGAESAGPLCSHLAL